MQVTRSCFSIRQLLPQIGMVVLLLMGVGCSRQSSISLPRTVAIQQKWQLQPGQVVAGRRISGGIGDISVELNGANVYAPFDGTVQPTQSDCVLFTSPKVPAYLMRLCGLQQTQLGELRQGQVLGGGRSLQFATMRKQSDGTWAMVEPSTKLLERVLQQL